MAEEMSRRERKKLESRNALVSAALSLFEKRPFDQVTVADIAEEADLDPSTFFRHFGSKEAVLFADSELLKGYIREELLRRPARESIITAAFVALERAFERLDHYAEQERVRQMVVLSTPSIGGWLADFLEQSIDTIASAIAERMEVDPLEDPRPRLVAALVVHGGQWVWARQNLSAVDPSDEEPIGELKQMLKDLVPVIQAG